MDELEEYGSTGSPRHVGQRVWAASLGARDLELRVHPHHLSLVW